MSGICGAAGAATYWEGSRAGVRRHLWGRLCCRLAQEGLQSCRAQSNCRFFLSPQKPINRTLADYERVGELKFGLLVRLLLCPQSMLHGGAVQRSVPCTALLLLLCLSQQLSEAQLLLGFNRPTH